MTTTYHYVYYHEPTNTDVTITSKFHPTTGLAADAADTVGVPEDELTHITVYETPREATKNVDSENLFVYWHPDRELDVVEQVNGEWREGIAKKNAAAKVGARQSDLVKITVAEVPVVQYPSVDAQKPE